MLAAAADLGGGGYQEAGPANLPLSKGKGHLLKIQLGGVPKVPRASQSFLPKAQHPQVTAFKISMAVSSSSS